MFRNLIIQVLKVSLPSLTILAGMALLPRDAAGKAEYTKKERKGCTFCHVVTGRGTANPRFSELTEAGKYYGEHKSLAGYKK